MSDPDELIDREVEVWWPEEEQWFSGVVAERGMEPDEYTEEGEEGYGWKVLYDDGDVGWFHNLRGKIAPHEHSVNLLSLPACDDGVDGW